MHTLYIVTAIHGHSEIHPDVSNGPINKSIMGLFDDLNEARRVVVDNVGDICEAGYHAWVVVESLTYPCVNPIAKIEAWYKWAPGTGRYEIFVPVKKFCFNYFS
jgi:hypothetical protein